MKGVPETFIDFYNTELDRVLRAPGGPVGRFINRYSREVAVEAQALAAARLHRRTGRYAGGFKVKVDRGAPGEGFKFTISNNVTGLNPRRPYSYAGVIEHGSRPHVIRPRDPNGFLMFTINGKKIVTREVHHPGTRPRHILRDAELLVRRRHGF